MDEPSPAAAAPRLVGHQLRFWLASRSATAAAARACAAAVRLQASVQQAEERLQTACAAAVEALRAKSAAEHKRLQAVEEELTVRAGQLAAAATMAAQQAWDAADLQPFLKLCQRSTFDGGEPTVEWASGPLCPRQAVVKRKQPASMACFNNRNPRKLRRAILVADASPAHPQIQLRFWNMMLDLSGRGDAKLLIRKQALAADFMQRVCGALDAWCDEPSIHVQVCAVMHNFFHDCPNMRRDFRVTEQLCLRLVPAFSEAVASRHQKQCNAVLDVLSWIWDVCAHQEAVAAQLLAMQSMTPSIRGSDKDKNLFLIRACVLPQVHAAVAAAGGLSKFVAASIKTPGRILVLLSLRKLASSSPCNAQLLLGLGVVEFVAKLTASCSLKSSMPRIAVEVLYLLMPQTGAKQAMVECQAVLELASAVFTQACQQLRKLNDGKLPVRCVGCDAFYASDDSSDESRDDVAARGPCNALAEGSKMQDWGATPMRRRKRLEKARAQSRQLMAFLA